MQDRLRQILILGAYGLPGMSLKSEAELKREAEPAPRPPLVRRCNCGRPISRNKALCRACMDLYLHSLTPEAQAAAEKSAKP